MRTIYFIFALGMSIFFNSCSGNENSEKKAATEIPSEKPDPETLASSYCECLTNSTNTDSCGQLSLNYAMKLATDKAALDLYHLKTDQCIDAKMEADMSKAMDKLDEMEKKAIVE
jgi:hypothetical protein